MSYRVSMVLLRALVRCFFRRVEITGLEHVPRDRGGILVAWHPNGLIDPTLILARFPGRLVFGARHGLFRWPLLGWLMRSIGTVPIYRAIDAPADNEQRREANRASLTALARRIVDGSFSALFPEGVSHDEPFLKELKTGAARLYYMARAMQPPDVAPPVIIPVGLHYDKKHLFRSGALVSFHAPLDLPRQFDVREEEGESEQIKRERYRALTAEIEKALHDVVRPTEDWETHHLMHRVRKLMRAERGLRAGIDPGRPRIQEKQLGFARVWTGYQERARTHAAEVAKLMTRVREYDADLRAMQMEDHELDKAPRLASPWLALILLAQIATVYILLPPLLIVGYVVNLPAAVACLALAKWAGSQAKDEASIKVIAGALLFPLSWLAAGLLAAWGHTRLHQAFASVPDAPVFAGLVTLALGAAGGAVALRYGGLSRETVRAMRIRLRRRRRWYTVARLKVERRKLCDIVAGLSEGLELPGEVAADGRVRQAPES